MSRTLPAVALGLLVGAVLAVALPASWVFVTEPGHQAAAKHDGAVKYACPMFCVVLDEPTPDNRCPVCGMQLAPISGESTLDAQEQLMVGLGASSALRTPLVVSIRALGEVDYDETRLARVTTRVQGWLSDVRAGTTWEPVEKDAPLASIYSPELYAAAQELLVALDAPADAADPVLVAAAERRLHLLGVADDEIAGIRAAGEAPEHLVLRAPRDGVIVERSAVEGAAVQRGALLYTIADLSRVWVQTEVFETDLAQVRAGQAARLQVVATGAESTGRVAFVDPVIDRTTRTARVRVEVDNPLDAATGERPLRVGQRVSVRIEARLDQNGEVLPSGDEPSSDPVSIPRSAVLRTGQRTVAYVLFTESTDGTQRDYQLDPQRLPPRVHYELVQLRVGLTARRPGTDTDDRVVVLGVVPPAPHVDPQSGAHHAMRGLDALTPGVAVVTSGNLLLDSQAQLSGKPSLLFPEGNRGTSSQPHSGH